MKFPSMDGGRVQTLTTLFTIFLDLPKTMRVRREMNIKEVEILHSLMKGTHQNVYR